MPQDEKREYLTLFSRAARGLPAVPRISVVNDLFSETDIQETLNRLCQSQVCLFLSERELGEFRRLTTDRRNVPSCYYVPIPVDMQADTNLHFVEHRRNRFRIGICGRPNAEDRIHVLFRALSQLNGSPTEVIWLIEDQERGAALRLLAEFEISGSLRSPRTAATWRGVNSEIDVAVHLLVSAQRNFGPYLPLSLAAGTPTLVSNIGDGAMLDDEVAFKISTGVTEERELIAVLQVLREKWQSGGHTMMVDRSREYVREIHSATVVSAELRMVFELANNGELQT